MSTYLKQLHVQAIPLINKDLSNIIKLKLVNGDNTGIIINYKFIIKYFILIKLASHWIMNLTEQISRYWTMNEIEKNDLSVILHMNNNANSINKKEDIRNLHNIYKSVKLFVQPFVIFTFNHCLK